MDCSTPGFPVLCHLLELAETHVHCVSDAIQPPQVLFSPSPPAFSLSQDQGVVLNPHIASQSPGELAWASSQGIWMSWYGVGPDFGSL